MSETQQYSGRLFLVTAPSGAGKSSLVNALLQLEPAIKLSISHTTRAPRPGEENGREYHFVTVEEFEAMKARGDFLESALVHGNYYGTSRVWIEEQMKAGNDVLLEIDWQGARQFANALPAPSGSSFCLPPSKRSSGVCTTAARIPNRPSRAGFSAPGPKWPMRPNSSTL